MANINILKLQNYDNFIFMVTKPKTKNIIWAHAEGQEEEKDPIEALGETIPGAPGEDYPIFAFPPETSFLCDGRIQGYYADPEADCQAFHICANLALDDELTKYSLLCPNGTLFNQQYFICDWWFNVDCSLSESLYSLNEDIAAEQAANTPDGVEGKITRNLQ